MDLFKNIKIFSGFEQTIKTLNLMINIIRGIALCFLILQTVLIFKDKSEKI